MTLKEEEALNQWLDEQLKAGLIVELKLRYAASYFYIPKKDGSLWLVQDYRKLNQVTIKNKMPLPLIGEVIDKLKEAKYFNKLNFIWGYNNMQIKKGDKWKVAFLTNKGSFKPQIMYFRLCNSPGTFQRMINSIFQELCDFNMKEIPILEVVIGKGQVQIEQDKIKAVKEWKIPTKIKEVESFLGFANFYRRFI